MNILELENAFPTPHFHFNEAASWIGKEVYLKHLRLMGSVEEMKRTEIGYDLLIDCGDFTVTLSKQEFARYADLKPGQVQLPVMH